MEGRKGRLFTETRGPLKIRSEIYSFWYFGTFWIVEMGATQGNIGNIWNSEDGEILQWQI